MKKYSVMIMSAALVASSCTTGAGTGAYAGSSLGSILGSAIGGIAGGPRGSDIGTIFGMAGGAVVGAAVGDAATKQHHQDQDDTYMPSSNYNNKPVYEPSYSSNQQPVDDIDPTQMVDTTNSGDDRIDFDVNSSSTLPNNNPDTSVSMDAGKVEQIYGANKAAESGKITIKNVRFEETAEHNVLHGGEVGKVKFEMYNETQAPIYNFMPTVVEADGNKRIYISPSVRVENIMPGQGLRYTATVKADKRIKDGEIRLLVSAQRDGKPISYVTVVKVATVR
ncbi:hypothetical protein [Prevotella sp.]|uniref:hypothetical protein n=1 Tax=Prevotella sp. TaxID=59823 RepID=UPI0030778EE0